MLAPTRCFALRSLAAAALSMPGFAQGLEWVPGRTLGEPFQLGGHLAITDVDGDGLQDVVRSESSFGFGSMVWHKNPGDPDQEWTEVSIDPNPADLVARGDLDGDGSVDLVTFRSGNLDVWRNDLGDGTSWSSITVGFVLIKVTESIHTADFDGDGDLDVVSPIPVPAGIAWYENQSGDGTLWNRRDLPYAYNFIGSSIPADVDHDGDLDVLFSSTFVVGWMENLDGSGLAWTEHALPGGDANRTVRTVADLDGDGIDEVIVTNPGSGIERYRDADGDGQGWSVTQVDPTESATQFEAADLDLDGDLDLLVNVSPEARLLWLENVLGDGSLLVPDVAIVTDVTTGAGRGHALGSVDDDAFPELVLGDLSPEGIQLYDAQPGNRFALPGTPVTVDVDTIAAPVDLAVDDVDGDGDLDLVGAFEVGGRIDYWGNAAGGAFWTDNPVATLPSPVALATEDFDGDGDRDVLAASSSPGSVAWFANPGNGQGTWVGTTLDTLAGPSAVDAADVDGDGDPDALVAADGAGAVGWIENLLADGSSWSTHTIDGVVPGASWIHAADLDADGDCDALGADALLATLAWFENDDGVGGAWSTRPVAFGVAGARRLLPSDLDLDGDLDLVGLGASEPGVVLLENADGAGTSWTRSDVTLPGTTRSDLLLEDVDLDGRDELFVATDESVSWLDARDASAGDWTVRTWDDGAASALAAVVLDVGNAPALVVGDDGVATELFPNAANLLRYGVEPNPRDSLVALTGRTNVGNTWVAGLDNPLGTQSPGALGQLALSLAPAPGFPAGLPLAGKGMGGPGAVGELLVDLSPGLFLPPLVSGADWDGSGPAAVPLAIPDDAALIDLEVFVQGVLIDPTAAFGVRIGLTSGLRVTVESDL